MVVANRLNKTQDSGHVLDKWVVEYCCVQKVYHICTLRDAIDGNIHLIKNNVTNGNTFRIIAVVDLYDQAALIVRTLQSKSE